MTVDSQTSPPPKKPPLRDDLAYMAPMAVFLLFTLGVSYPKLYVPTYVAKALIVPILLYYLWPHFTRIKWTHKTLGFAVGVIGIIQWIGMEKLLIHFFIWAHNHHLPVDWLYIYGKIAEKGVPTDSFNPFQAISNPALCWTFIAIRWSCAVFTVPVMEELFWRDFVWRTAIAPNDFKLAKVGEWDAKAFIFVALIFATVHIQWLTAIVWALMIGWLLVKTKSLGACIIAHATTNFCLGAYVLYTHDWYFW
jgi:hypothetical protein